MAERTISTRLIVEGEKEYRAAIKAVNGSLKEMDSALKLVDAQFAGQKNTLSALQAKHEALSGVLDKQKDKLEAEKTALEKSKSLYTSYSEAAASARKKLESLSESTDDAAKDTDEYRKKVGDLQREIAKYDTAAEKAATATQNHATKANQAEAKLIQLNEELAKNERYLDEAKVSADGCASSMDRYGREVKEAAEQSNKGGEASKGWLGTLKALVANDLIQSGIRKLGEVIKEAAKASIEFESAMAGVAKTTDLTDYELTQMSEAIKEMSTRIPLSTTEIAALAEVGGQLGIAKEDLLSFVEVMAMLGTSTNLSAEEAAEALAQMANIMGTSADDYERLGSTLVALGNSSATTERDILNMAQRLAAAGAAAGMSEAEVLALAAAVSSMGTNAEAGGTALSTLLNNIATMVATGSEDLSEYAKYAGMTVDEFVDSWETDAMGTLSKLIEGLGQLGEDGGSIIAALAEDLGISEARMTAVVQAMAGNSGLLNQSLATAGKAWEENIALANEATTRYETLDSNIQMLKNKANNLLIAIGDTMTPILQGLVQGAGTAAEWATDLIEGSDTLSATVEEIDKAFAGKAENIAATVGDAEAMVKVLEKLEGKSTRTAAEQAQWDAVLARLVETMPSLNDLIDEQTGAIDGGTEALRRQIASWEELALAEAKQSALQDKYNAYVDAQTKLIDKQAELAIAQEKYKEVLAQGDERYGQYGDIASWYEKRWGTAMGVVYTDDPFDAKAYAEAKDTISALESEVADLSTELETNRGILDDYNEAFEELTISTTEQTEATKELTQAEKDRVQEFAAMSGSLDELIAKQSEAKEAAREQVEAMVSGFTEIEPVVAQSVADSIAALESQITYMAEYADNIKWLMELGIDENLVQKLSDGSVESMAVLAGLRQASEEDITAFVAKFQETEQAKETLTTNMADAATNFETEAQRIIDQTNDMVEAFNQESTAYSSGAATVQGYIDGMNSKLAELQSVAGQINSLSGSSHAAGLEYVPYDGYLAQLHEGEMVLTALQAKAYRAEQFANYGMAAKIAGNTTNNSNATFNVTINMPSGASRREGERIADELRREMRRRGVF